MQIVNKMVRRSGSEYDKSSARSRTKSNYSRMSSGRLAENDDQLFDDLEEDLGKYDDRFKK